ncbi:MAG: hypothetical protein P8X68_19080, partial [Desulfobacterales bacterium]
MNKAVADGKGFTDHVAVSVRFLIAAGSRSHPLKRPMLARRCFETTSNVFFSHENKKENAEKIREFFES